MKATATAVASAAPQAAAPANQPAWMSLTSMADLDAYIKKAKMSKVRAEEMRTRWNAAHPNDVLAEEENLDAALAAADTRNIVKAADDMAQGLAAVARKRLVSVPAQAPAPAPGLVTRYIDPQKIDIREGWNARVDFGDIQELAASIKAQKKLDGHGLINDIRVKEKADGRYELIDGERRLHSVMHLIEQEGEVFEFGIPAKVEPAESTDADLIIKMFTANMGKPFLPYEEATYYKRLRDSGMTITQIEEKTGRSDNSIVGALALLEADEDLVEAVVKGKIGATMAKSIAVNVRGNKARQKELTQKAKAAAEAAKKGDHKGMRAVKAEIEEERKAKAARTSKKLAERMAARVTMRGIDEVSALGTEVAARLKDLMEKVGMPHDADLEEWASNDRELQVAVNFGALQALKYVMGQKVKVTA